MSEGVKNEAKREYIWRGWELLGRVNRLVCRNDVAR